VRREAASISARWATERILGASPQLD